MPVMDEFKEEREALKHGTPKEKLRYFWDYYKWHVIAGAAILLLGGSLIYQVATNKEPAFYGVFLNCLTTENLSDAFLSDFAQTAGIDLKKNDVVIDSSLTITEAADDQSSYATIEKITVYLAAKEIDVIAADVANFNRYAYQDVFGDLREFLTPEQQKVYEPYFYYIDRKVLNELEEARSNLEDYIVKYPDPAKPEEMTEPVPVAIYLTDCSILENKFQFYYSPAVIGIPLNTTKKETAQKFIDYLFSETAMTTGGE